MRSCAAKGMLFDLPTAFVLSIYRNMSQRCCLNDKNIQSPRVEAWGGGERKEGESVIEYSHQSCLLICFLKQVCCVY